MLPVEYPAEVARIATVPVAGPALRPLATGGSGAPAQASLAGPAGGQCLRCTASFPCGAWAGESTGELVILVAVGSAGTVPGGTSSVFFGKGCEMIDRR